MDPGRSQDHIGCRVDVQSSGSEKTFHLRLIGRGRKTAAGKWKAVAEEHVAGTLW